MRRSADPPPPDDLLGIGRRPVRVHRVEPLAVWYSERDRSGAGADDPRVHDRVVRAALNTATPLPCRHDSVLGDLDEVTRIMSARRDALADRLARVEGCVEVAVRVRPPEIERSAPAPEAAGGGGPGREYMVAARGRRRRREEGLVAAEDLVRSGLRGLPILDIVAAASRGGGVDVAVLVQRDGIGAVRERIAGLVRTGGAIVGSTGPWPPYSFVAFPGPP